MPKEWIVNCPECGRQFEIPPDDVFTDCGQAISNCTCPKCGHQFQASQDFQTWLGVDDPAEGGPARSRTPN